MRQKNGKTTIRDVAREAGVSTALVSMVINARVRADGTLDCPVNRQTAARIQAVVKRLNYLPNKAAASLRKGQRHTIGVICPDMARQYFAEISRHIENVAYSNGYTVLFGSSDDRAQKFGELVTTFIADGVDGLLVTPCMDCHAHIQRAIDLGVPVVLMTRDLPGQDNVGKVLLDNKKAIQMALGHMFSAGYRRIEMISNSSGLSNLTHRENLYMEEMSTLGISAYARISRVRDDNVPESMEILLEEAIRRGTEAILFPGASLGGICFSVMRRMGRRIPEDLAIMSFDGGREYTMYSPSITQIQQSRSRTAEEAFRMLTDMTRGGEPRTILLEPTFTEGGSTACIHPERLAGTGSVSDIAKMDGKNSLLVPAVAFSDRGGWCAETQFLDTVGSSYLMAHGLGAPVDDARTDVELPCEGDYNVLVRTMNWTAPWSDAPSPGTFRLLIDGRPLPPVLGEGPGEWGWQDAGKVHLAKGRHRLGLRDLHGFDARVDSILLTTTDCIPGGDAATVRKLRSLLLPTPRLQRKIGYDLVIAGAGMAGICAAVTAARLGLKVALIHDRNIPGGNNSSEVRAGLSGRINTGRYPSLGYLLNEFGPEEGGDAMPAEIYGDAAKRKIILDEKGISLFAGFRVDEAVMDGGTIKGVHATNAETYDEIEVYGTLFADCTGEGTLGALAGAGYSNDLEDGCSHGASVHWFCSESGREEPFPDINWGLSMDPDTAQKVRRSEWNWATGFFRNHAADAERIRDYGMYAAYSNWSYLKNHAPYRDEYRCSLLTWMATVPARRGGRRLTGDVVVSRNDLLNNVPYPDGCVCTSWPLETREPDPGNMHTFKEPWLCKRTLNPVKAFMLPYRCLYSRNIHNLFMAGRSISVSHQALGTIAPMRTCAMTGEVVGMAAAICRQEGSLPAGIYPSHWEKLEKLMHRGAGRTDIPYTQVYDL